MSPTPLEDVTPDATRLGRDDHVKKPPAASAASTFEPQVHAIVECIATFVATCRPTIESIDPRVASDLSRTAANLVAQTGDPPGRSRSGAA